MSDVIDLDALVPQAVTIRIGNEELEVPPPTMAQLMSLGSLGQRMQEASTMSADEITQLTTDITNKLVEMIPALIGKNLNTAQILKLVSIISDMGIPKDIKELKDRGIEPNSPKAQ